MTHLRLVTASAPASDVSRSAPAPDGAGRETSHDGPVVPIRLLLTLSGRCSCVECCASELARRAGREWVHPKLRAAKPVLRALP